MNRLFVDNFDSNANEQSITDLFQSKGRVKSVTMVRHHGQNETEGHAIVVMASDREAVHALRSLNNTKWNGARLTVTAASQLEQRRGFTGGACLLQRKQK